ncbi:hypothetical protein VTO42DRAFT_7192 [Malbranchea cinnamomea]
MASPFDPYTQDVIFHDRDGNPFSVPIAELNELVQYNTKVSINYGAQLGACIVMLFVVSLLTAPVKRRTVIFALNVTALFCGIVRMLCMTIYFTTEFSEAYRYFASDFSNVPTGAYVNSILGVVMTTILLVCVEASLLVQTQAICSTLRRRYQQAVLGFSLAVVLATIALRLVLTVENCKSIVRPADFSPFVWLQSANNLIIMASVCYFSAIFMAKLGYAIYTRRKLGVTGFGGMQVIFVMSCQTMVVPAIFSIVTYFVSEFELNQNVLTLMAISLPLTSIWATTAVKHQHQENMTDPESQRRRLWEGTISGGSLDKTSFPVKTFHGCESSSDGTLLGRSTPDLERASDLHAARNFSLSSERY